MIIINNIMLHYCVTYELFNGIYENTIIIIS